MARKAELRIVYVGLCDDGVITRETDSESVFILNDLVAIL